MATVTRKLASWNNDEGRIEIDYDSVNLRISAIRCVNGSSQAAYAWLKRVSDGLLYGQRFPPNQTTMISVPTNSAATRLTYTIGSTGKFEGVIGEVMFPYP